MSVEYSSALTLRDLVLEIALQMGVAYYGENGDGVAEIPDDEHDLAECMRHANNAVRMFIANAPPTGWRWTRPVGYAIVWADLEEDDDVTVTGGTPANDQTLITCNTEVFHETMEEKNMVVDGIGTLVIKRYVSTTEVYVYGDHGFAAASTFSIANTNNFTLPRTFAGTFSGQITFAAQTNRALDLEWCDESTIRRMRENTTTETGTPVFCAIDVFESFEGRRRYRLSVHPAPDEEFTLRFPYALHFEAMTDLTETLPTPISHDEAIRAACLAVVERDVDGMKDGPKEAYYRTQCLPNSHNIDAQSGPRKLGYFGNNVKSSIGIRNFRDFMQRPNVGFNP